MERHLSSQELRAQLGEAIDSVRLRGDHFIIERRGKPVAALVPIEVIDKERDQRSALNDLWKKIRQNSVSELEEDEAMALVNEEIAEVRKELRKVD